jgi:peptide/nickel transport system substrate-binding protein
MGDGAFGRQFVDDIEGEQAFLDGKAGHISGLRTAGDQLMITLVRPSPNLPERLSTPFFCPVPTGTALIPGATNLRSTTSEGQIPSAGPYYVADHTGPEFVILKRNPNYTGPRPHQLDAIALRESVDPGLAVQRVQSEGWDGITNTTDPVLEPEGALAARWGPGSAAAGKGGQRYYAVLQGGVQFLEFNANSTPFSNIRVREAASLALDTALLGRIVADAVPAGDLLAANLPGVSIPSSGPLPRPDLDRARELMRGRAAKALMAINPPDQCPTCAQLADAVKSELAQIGIDVRIKVPPAGTSAYGYAHSPGTPVDIRLAGFGPDPDALVDLTRYLSNFSEGFADWWPAGVRKVADGLASGTKAELEARAQALVALLKDQAVLAPVAHTIQPAYLSPSLGCRVFPPFGYGVDLAALCLRPS